MAANTNAVRATVALDDLGLVVNVPAPELTLPLTKPLTTPSTDTPAQVLKMMNTIMGQRRA